jgi:hypothetical protein
VKALLRMSWWDLEEEELRRLAPMFDRPQEMLRKEGLL